MNWELIYIIAALIFTILFILYYCHLCRLRNIAIRERKRAELYAKDCQFDRLTSQSIDGLCTPSKKVKNEAIEQSCSPHEKPTLDKSPSLKMNNLLLSMKSDSLKVIPVDRRDTTTNSHDEVNGLWLLYTLLVLNYALFLQTTARDDMDGIVHHDTSLPEVKTYDNQDNNNAMMNHNTSTPFSSPIKDFSSMKLIQDQMKGGD